MAVARAEHRRLKVEIDPPYEVIIGAGAMDSVLGTLPHRQVALISDETVFDLHGRDVEQTLSAQDKEVLVCPFPPGEASKSLDRYGQLLEQLSLAGFDRGCAVLALGGGITGDLAGFVAASYLRGVAFYQLPTSLLAMVDASVGGKTGLNLPQGKNLVGAFWQPQAVAADITLLRTLPDELFREGAVEHFKHGLLADSQILEDISNTNFSPRGDPDFLSDTIARSVAVKASIVAQDEREAGPRAFLNLGHTLAHALEAATDHALSHGDAVAYGLLFSAHLAKARGFTDLTGQVLDFLHWLGPAPLEIQDFTLLLPYLYRDKKVAEGRLRFVLLEDLNQPILIDDISEYELNDAWHNLRVSL